MREFPVFKTKVAGLGEKFMLEDPAERRRYFQAKAGSEIEKLRLFLEKNTFVAFLLGPKNSGKGTYIKLFMEAVGTEHLAHISVGDTVRAAKKAAEDPAARAELESFLRKKYRGFGSVEEVIKGVTDWSVKTLLSTEGILALVEWQVDQIGRKAIFIDGFPRSLDQVSLALYFRALVGYRDDPDFFVFIDVPEAVIDERMKYRVICPECQTPRNPKLLRTKEVGYDEPNKEFYLLCDNPACSGFGKTRLVGKKGDELGIEAIRDRLEADQKVMATLLELQGVPKVYLRNSVPAGTAKELVDDYELTPAFRYELEGGKVNPALAGKGGVKVIEEPWTIKDENGAEAYSLLPPPVVLALIKQTAQVLGL